MRRWDGYERGRGIGDAGAFVPGVSELVEAMQEQHWVAEEPEAHLLPHLERACESLPFELLQARTSASDVFEVELRWLGERDRVGDVREGIYGLVGSFAETATYVRQRREPGSGLLFEVVTGTIAHDAPFAPHGHTLSLRVAGVF